MCLSSDALSYSISWCYVFSLELEFRQLDGLPSVKVDVPSPGLVPTTTATRLSSAEKEEVVITSSQKALLPNTQTAIAKPNTEIRPEPVKPKEQLPVKHTEVEAIVISKPEPEKPKEVEIRKLKPSEQASPDIAKPFLINSTVKNVKPAELPKQAAVAPKVVEPPRPVSVAAALKEVEPEKPKTVVEPEKPKAPEALKPKVLDAPAEKTAEVASPPQDSKLTRAALNPEVTDVVYYDCVFYILLVLRT